MAGEVLRRMEYPDLGQVHRIETLSFPNPWPRAAFMHAMLAGHECWVIELEARILAYGVMDLAAREGHLLNICVAEDVRRKGYGKRLLEHFLSLAAREADSVMLLVRESNRSARRLYVKMGFELSGVRSDYYPTPRGREDALVFRRVQKGADDEQQS